MSTVGFGFLILTFICIAGQYTTCSWGKLNLTSLTELYLACHYTASYKGYGLQYTPCRNKELCSHYKTHDMVAKWYYDGDPVACVGDGGSWDNGTIQPIETKNVTSGEYNYTFHYTGLGGEECPNGTATTIEWICDQHAVPYQISGCGDSEDDSCHFWLDIRSTLACVDNHWTTTTTAQPDDECIFKANHGDHILNLNSIRGELLSYIDHNSSSNDMYFMYTPCNNTAKCDDDTLAMAYIFDGQNFECKQYIAQWENGINQPDYNEEFGIWQFTYTNGEECNGGQTVFIIEWVCDKSSLDPKVIGVKEIGSCVYQMMINSYLACG